MKSIISRWVVVGIAVAELSFMVCHSLANNVVVTNTTLKAPGAGKVQVQFDLAWDNSWRDGVNYDACWVFVKYSTNGGTNWSHATLAASGTNPAGFTCGRGTNLEIVVPADKTGAFIQRSVAGTGTVANTWVQLVWDFTSNGVVKSQSARVKVFALEMVYVAQGAFWAGDGATTALQANFEDATNGTPFLVTNENYAIILGGGAPGSLGNNNLSGMANPDDFDDVNIKTLPAAFPKGFTAFYLMKTEMSQRQYCDFLNTLTYNQQNGRHDSTLHFNESRNFIKKTSGSPAFFGCDANNNAGPSNAVDNVALLNEVDDGGWVACNYIGYIDGLAYVCWAALRPFTELEYEKACRGTNAVVAHENAWGTINFGPLNTSLTSSNTTLEVPNQGNCNAGGTPTGPYRVGCYATASSSSRTNAGAAYYGALDLSGSLAERIVSVGIADGRAFTGSHGDGSLRESDGWPASMTWPWSGFGIRDRGWDVQSWLEVSQRRTASWNDGGRYNYIGFRGVRTAPASTPSPGGSHDAYFYGGPGDSSSMDQSQDRSLFLPAGTIFKIR